MHTCSSVLFKCIDFRLMKEFVRFLNEQKLLGDIDEVSIAGSSKELVDGNQTVQDFLLQNIKISNSLHHAQTVILLHHSQCGAYAAKYDFASSAAEKAQQLADMAEAVTLIQVMVPGLKVRKFWAELLDETGQQIEFSEIK